MSSSSNSIEIQIQSAVDAYKRAENPKITQIAREFNVPYTRLYRRLQGIKSKQETKPANYKLDKYQENVLHCWITQMDDIGCPPTASLIEHHANSILRQSHPDQSTSPPIVGQNWAYRFIERLPPEYKLRKQKPMDPKRLTSEDITSIENWYEYLGAEIQRHKLQPTDIYDFDEIGFLEGKGRTEEVVTQFPMRNGNLSSSYSKKLITVLECISADGALLPPLVIPPGRGHMEDWYSSSNLPDDWVICPSPTGYTSDEIAYAWIQHFHEHSKARQKGKYRLLLLDNHGSHLTREFIQFAEDNQIILFPLPPHTTHFLQPLDNLPFQQYKHFHGKAVNEAARKGWNTFERREILPPQ